MGEYPHAQLTEKIIGAAIAVHRALGPGFLECIHENALKHKLQKRGFHVEQQKVVPVFYDDVQVGEHRLDLVVESCVLLESKAVDAAVQMFFPQVISSLKASRLTVGLIINFDEKLLKNGIKRVILTDAGEHKTV